MSRVVRRRLRAALLVLVGALFVASIPWYRDPAAAPASTILGLPDWVFVALVCYVAAALVNSLAWLLSDVSDEERRGPDSP